MKLANFSSNEFIDQTVLDSAETLTRDSLLDITGNLHTPGLINASALSFSYSNLTITVDAPLPFYALFSDGTLASANGATDGSTSSSATVDFSSLVPSTGSVTAYLIATSGSVAQGAFSVIGPPVGHPDHNPNFAPYTAYSEQQDTIQFQATTTAPDNTDTLFIASTVLSAGQTTITASSTVGQVRAGAILSRNGEVIAADLGSGAAASNVGTLGGSLVGTLPNPTLAATGVDSGTYINPVTITVDEDGRISDIANVSNWNVPGNVTAASAQIDGILTISMNGEDGGMIGLEDTTSGQTTPKKYIRSDSGEFQIINSAYSQLILSLTDSGDLSVPGTFNAGNTSVGSLTASSAQINGNLTATGSTSLQAVSATTGTFSGEVTVAPATQNNAAVQLAQVYQYISNTGTSASFTVTPGNCLFTHVENYSSVATTCTIEPGTVVGQQIKITAGISTIIQSNVTSGSPFFWFPDISNGHSFTINGWGNQGWMYWDGANWQVQTFGQMIVAPAAASNEAVQLGQLTNGSLSPTFGETVVAPATQSNAAVQLGQITDGSIDAEFGNLTATGSTYLQAVSATTGSFSGEVTVAPATQNNAAVQLDQVLATTPQYTQQDFIPVSGDTYTISVSFTAPSNGFIVGIATQNNSRDSQSATIQQTLSINGTNYGADNTLASKSNYGIASVSAGTACTVTNTLVVGTSTGTFESLSQTVVAIFIPNP